MIPYVVFEVATGRIVGAGSVKTLAHIADHGEDRDVLPSQIGVDVPPEVLMRDYVVSGVEVVLRPQVELDAAALKEKKDHAKLLLRRAVRKMESSFLAKYPRGERAAFPQKEEAAHNWLDGAARPRDLLILDEEIGEAPTDADRDALANTVVAKANAMRAASARIARTRKRVEAMLDAAASEADVDAALALLGDL